MHTAEGSRVPGDSVVPVMPPQLAKKLGMLPCNGRVPMPLTPQVDPPQKPGDPVGGRLTLHHPVAPTRLFPKVGEPEKVKAPRSLVRLHLPRLCLAARPLE